jgi:hypothetical protein
LATDCQVKVGKERLAGEGNSLHKRVRYSSCNVLLYLFVLLMPHSLHSLETKTSCECYNLGSGD